MADESNTYSQEWVSIESITLTNHKGVTEDILKFFMGIDIQEDIFKATIIGQLSIIDTVNFYEEFPIVGEELLTITYSDFFGNTTTQTFFIYGVNQKVKNSERQNFYVLDFCSEELFYNRDNIYSKSYKDKLACDIFKDAFSRCSPTKPLVVQPTVELQDYIATNIYPFDVCKDMCTRAISTEGHEGSYVFYEDKDKFNFVSIEKLIQASPVEYKVGDANLYSITDKWRYIKNYKLAEPVNNLKRKMSGAHGVKTKTLDLINRKIEDNSYDYHNDEDYTKVTRSDSNNPDLRQTTKSYRHKANDSMYKVLIKNNDDNSKSTKPKVMSRRYSTLGGYVYGTKINAELPFTANLTVGQTLKIHMAAEDGREDDMPDDEKYISGTYIIMALRQLIKPNSGVTVVELAKNTYMNSVDEFSNYKPTGSASSL